MNGLGRSRASLPSKRSSAGLLAFLRRLTREKEEQEEYEYEPESPVPSRSDNVVTGSLDTLLSTATVASFAFVPGSLYRDDKRQRALEDKQTTLQYSKTEEVLKHRRTVSESAKFAKVHVKGKRRAPEPPVKITRQTGSRKKRRAPQPPQQQLPKLSEEEQNKAKEEAGAPAPRPLPRYHHLQKLEKQQVEASKPQQIQIGDHPKTLQAEQYYHEVVVPQRPQRDHRALERSATLSEVEAASTIVALRLEQGVLKQDKTERGRTEPAAPSSPVSPRPWYKRSANRAKEWAEKRSLSEGGPPRLSFLSSEKRWTVEDKRKSRISILTNISELDREAAEIIERQRAGQRRTEEVEEVSYYRPPPLLSLLEAVTRPVGVAGHLVEPQITRVTIEELDEYDAEAPGRWSPQPGPSSAAEEVRQARLAYFDRAANTPHPDRPTANKIEERIRLKEMLKDLKHSLPKRPPSETAYKTPCVTRVEERRLPGEEIRADAYLIESETRIEEIRYKKPNCEKVSSSSQTSGHVRRLGETADVEEFPPPKSTILSPPIGNGYGPTITGAEKKKEIAIAKPVTSGDGWKAPTASKEMPTLVERYKGVAVTKPLQDSTKEPVLAKPLVATGVAKDPPLTKPLTSSAVTNGLKESAVVKPVVPESNGRTQDLPVAKPVVPTLSERLKNIQTAKAITPNGPSSNTKDLPIVKTVTTVTTGNALRDLGSDRPTTSAWLTNGVKESAPIKPVTAAIPPSNPREPLVLTGLTNGYRDDATADLLTVGSKDTISPATVSTALEILRNSSMDVISGISSGLNRFVVDKPSTSNSPLQHLYANIHKPNESILNSRISFKVADSELMSTIGINRLLRKLETAIANGQHDLAAGLAKDLAMLKVNCSVTRQVPDTSEDQLTVEMYVEDKVCQEGPISMRVRAGMTVRELKEKLERELGVPKRHQRWILSKKLATEDSATLGQLGVQNNDPVFLYLIAQEGGEKEGKDASAVMWTASTSTCHNLVPSSEPIRPFRDDQPSTSTAVPSTLQHGWKCEVCTLVNSPTRPGCAACTSERPRAYVVPKGHVATTTEASRIAKEHLVEQAANKVEEETKLLNYQKLIELEKNELVVSTEGFECPVCLVDCPPGEGIVLRECLHSFCRQCLIGTVQFSEEAEVRCPYRDNNYTCDSIMLEREIKALVSPQVYEEHLAKSIAVAENNIENAFHCKTPDCRGWCIYEDNVNIFYCPVCTHVNCLTCQAIHEGLDCKQFQEQLSQDSSNNVEARRTKEMLKEMVDRGEAMNCPTCQVVLMKKWGCDWLRCSMCKTEICWVTRGPRWGPNGKGDTTGGCQCGVNGVKCHPKCNYCH